MWNPHGVNPETNEEDKNEAKILSHGGSKGRIMRRK